VPDLAEGWTTTAVCLAGAAVLLAALRRAVQRAELALRDKLLVVLAAGGLATAGVGASMPPDELARQVVSAASGHPLVVAGAIVAIALGTVVVSILWWIRFWVRTVLRILALGVCLGLVALWCVARFALAPGLDAWTGASLGTSGWHALLDGGGVAAVVALVVGLLRSPPPRGKELA
jgi:hypothetical protein